MVEFLESLLSNDQFVDWLVLAFSCAIFWFFSNPDRREPHPVPMPRWLAILVRRPPGTPISVHQVAWYAFTFLWFVWDTVVVILVPSHETRIALAGAGALVLLLLDSLYVVIVYFIQNSHRDSGD